MANTIANTEATSNTNLLTPLGKIQDNLCNLVLNTAGLVIGSSSKKAVKTANTIYAINGRSIISKTSAETALAGTTTNAKFNVYVLYLTSAGALAIAMGTEGATLGAVVLPTIPASSAVLGFVIVNPTGTGDFVGGTTDLDDGTVVPNAVYVNTPFPFNPNTATL